MMHLTLDTLLTNDPSSGLDMTGEWEEECNIRNSPKMKFPLKLIDDSMEKVDLTFGEPELKDPEPKKKKKLQDHKIINVGQGSKKEKKKRLF
jgi:hypothetical protein